MFTLSTHFMQALWIQQQLVAFADYEGVEVPGIVAKWQFYRDAVPP